MDFELKRGMTIDECKVAIRILVKQHGPYVLANQWMDDHGYNALRRRVSYLGMSFEAVAKELHIHDEWKQNIRTRYAKRNAYTVSDVQNLWSKLIQERGAIVLHKGWLSQHGYVNLQSACKRLQVHKIDIAEENGVLQEYITYVNTTKNRWSIEQRWTTERIHKCFKDIADMYDGIPSQPFLAINGHSALLGALNRAKIPFIDIVEKYGGIRTRLTSKNGLVWRSYPECAVSDYLYVRGVQHTLGKRYDLSSVTSCSSNGVYDMHFIANKEPFLNQVIDVEIWGPENVHYSTKYKRKKELKLLYNKNNPNFLGIEYDNCYKDCNLCGILDKYIDVNTIVNAPSEGFVSDTSKWSLLEKVVVQANQICETLGRDKIPPSNWFRRYGEYCTRHIYEWEPKSWHQFLYNISLIGGFIVLRKARLEC
jgi:hypothetical protein